MNEFAYSLITCNNIQKIAFKTNNISSIHSGINRKSLTKIMIVLAVKE